MLGVSTAAVIEARLTAAGGWGLRAPTLQKSCCLWCSLLSEGRHKAHLLEARYPSSQGRRLCRSPGINRARLCCLCCRQLTRQTSPPVLYGACITACITSQHKKKEQDLWAYPRFLGFDISCR